MMRTNGHTVAALLRTVATVTALVGLIASTAAAQSTHTVRLIAAPFTLSVTLPDGGTSAVPMWGFAVDANENGILDPGETPTVPGPRITVPPGTSTLAIQLVNQLAVPTSLVVPGQAFDASPVRTADGRIISMTAETPPGTTGTYTFNSLRPGTFLYQSGSHQAVQVQMGLYGAATMDAVAAAPETPGTPAVPPSDGNPGTPATPGMPATPAEAYAGAAYDHDVLLLYSEVDVALHHAVADGTYGTPGGPSSTIDYKPSLFLINGQSYANELSPAVPAGVASERTLIRFLNAGLRTHAPVLENGALALVAEDGNAYPFVRPQASILLAAGKTHDALWTPASSGVFSVYDRALSLNAAGQGPAGMLARLTVGAGAAAANPVTASGDVYGTPEDVLLVIPAAGVLGNDTGASTAQLVTIPRSGGLVLHADGGFNYLPAPDFSGVDSFTYRAVNGTDVSEAATVIITVSPVGDGPTALAQAVGGQAPDEVPITLTGSDPDGDALTFYATALPANGTLSIVDPLTSASLILLPSDLRAGGSGGTPLPSGVVIFKPNPGFAGFDGLQFVVSDATSASVAAGVAITVHPPEVAHVPTGQDLSLTVVGSDGVAVTTYRWTLEEDRTYDVKPGVLDPNTAAVSFHTSYMPVVQSGDESTPPVVDPAKRYFVSVLPKETTHTNGGAGVAAGQTAVRVTVNKTPIPTAQVRARVFHDNSPTDGMWSTVEPGLPGFEVTLEDAGGRYGHSAADQLMDAYGNQLGTIYGPCTVIDDPSTPELETCTSLEVVRYGNGFVLTDADGYALFQNLSPGKYGVKVRVPAGAPWQQTSTIEGTRTIDAWVKANEPPFFMEFGPPSPHAEFGMVQATRDANVLGAGAGPFSTITGQVTNMHLARPPDPRMYSGAPFDFTRPWIALNAGAVGGTLIYAGPTNEEGEFSIAGVPSGSYQLVVFDTALDIIIGSKVVNVTAPTELALGPLPVFTWFHRQYHYVFEDTNENGLREEGEVGIPEQAINLRFRDGSVYQSMPTDGSGFVPFEQVFPFFSWQIAEVDYTRFKATGVTVVVDGGGDPNAAGNADWPSAVGVPDLEPRVLVPQPQSENADASYRVETGPVLLEAFQGFIGQTNVMLWGKAPYAPVGSIVTDVNAAPFEVFDPGALDPLTGLASGDVDANGNGAFDVDQFHGGISGIVHYSITRAENDPRWGGAELWEPGIPGVRVQLWDATRTKLLNEVTTDSWDESQPTGCQGPVFTYLGRDTDCYDGLRNFNQVRPGVFDGGYAFYTMREPFVDQLGGILPMEARAIEKPLPAGKYVVKVIAPNGYKIVKEEDKNVDFGEEYIPAQFLLTGYPLGDPGPADPASDPLRANFEPLWAPFCVGTRHEVPAELSLFPGVPGVYAGTQRPLCDAKAVNLRPGQNVGATFFLFTEAPVAAHITGFVLDDTANEFDVNSPQFGEKFAPPFLPVAIRDWTGREITRTYTDRYGVYNALVPSTFTAAAPIPSGMAPAMLTACINTPTMPGPLGALGEATVVPDPYFNRSYSHFCYTFQYMPGTTTYLDTPVLPTAAFTGADQFPVDAELPARTPVIKQVNGTALNIGPYIVDRGGANNGARTIVITSAGAVQVPNPAYDGLGGSQPKLITRDYGFGPASLNGVVRLGGQPINVNSWSNGQITAVVPTNTTANGNAYRTGQLTVERCITRNAANACTDSRESILGITLTVANPALHSARPPRVVPAGRTIQSVIDSASTQPGDLVMVRPGVYEEMVVMTKPVRLQGWGARVTVLNTVSAPAEKFQAWRDYVGGRLTASPGYLLGDQSNILGPPPFDTAELAAALGGEGAGVTVLGQNHPTLDLSMIGLPSGLCLQQPISPFTPLNPAYCLQNENPMGGLVFPPPTPILRPNARIDGFTIMGSSQGAGIMVNAWARFLEIGNNDITNNLGYFAGGIRVGHTGAPLPLGDEDAFNDDVRIHHNLITQNAGSTAEGGGGVVIGSGSDRYEISSNFIAANFTVGQGGGIAHIGLSLGGVIDRNTVIFNESFSQLLTRSGGGVFVGGRPPVLGGLTPGSGDVRVSNNLIQGNQAAAGDGGGIALANVNGADILQFANGQRYRVDLFNNVVSNNVAALAGGGVALQDAPYTRIVHNTIVHNDSLATAGGAFLNSPLESVPQPAGIVSRGHTPGLAQALGPGQPAFSNPLLVNSIIWENRSFYFGEQGGGVVLPGDPNPGPNPAPPTYGLIANPTSPLWDLGVLGGTAGAALNPRASVLTSTTGYHASNTSTAPAFVAQYFNGNRNPTIPLPEPTIGIQVPAAFDEGGNFIRPIFGPLSLTAATGPFWGNYHVTTGLAGAALNAVFGGPSNVPSALLFDFDRQPRPEVPSQGSPHRGSDQKLAAAPPTTPIPRQ